MYIELIIFACLLLLGFAGGIMGAVVAPFLYARRRRLAIWLNVTGFILAVFWPWLWVSFGPSQPADYWLNTLVFFAPLFLLVEGLVFLLRWATLTLFCRRPLCGWKGAAAVMVYLLPMALLLWLYQADLEPRSEAWQQKELSSICQSLGLDPASFRFDGMSHQDSDGVRSYAYRFVDEEKRIVIEIISYHGLTLDSGASYIVVDMDTGESVPAEEADEYPPAPAVKDTTEP